MCHLKFIFHKIIESVKFNKGERWCSEAYSKLVSRRGVLEQVDTSKTKENTTWN